MSSGLRINTAADDAAGYAIAQGMTSQINGLNQAAQNANDGVSLAQTASGALPRSPTTCRRCATSPSSRSTRPTAPTDRADLNAQFQQLVADINSVASNTQFNGVNLLDGSFQGATFQIGANAGQTITVSSVASAKAGNLGSCTRCRQRQRRRLHGRQHANGDTVTLAGRAHPGRRQLPRQLHDQAVTLTGNATTDLASDAAAMNQAVGLAGRRRHGRTRGTGIS